ncbi:MAG: cell division protein FtsA [bacterium]
MAKDSSTITGLDIGSSHIRTVVAQVSSEYEQPQILAVSASPSEGIHKGAVTSLDDAVTSISVALEQAERLAGCPIERAVVGLSSHHLTSQLSRGVVAVAKADGEIREMDIDRVLQAAQAVSVPPNYEILHVIPKSYRVDHQEGVKDPLGMTGIRLEVEAQLILGLTSQIKNLTRAIYRTGVDIDDLVLGILACAEAVLDKQQKELGVGLVNIGASTTNVAVFEEGELMEVAVIPVGSGHITADIAIGLRVAIDVAEKIKLAEGSAVPDELSKRDEILLSKYDPNEKDRVAKKQVAEIIEARLEEIFSLVQKELAKVNRNGMLPAGLVFTGGGAKLPDLISAARSYFKLPASLGQSKDTPSISEQLYDPEYATAYGLILWGLKHRARLSPRRGAGPTMKTIKEWLKNLLP